MLEINHPTYIIIYHLYCFRSLFISSLKAEDIFKWIQSNTVAEKMSSMFIRTRKKDNVVSYFDYNKVFIVDNESNSHWTFYCIFMESKIIAFYDSLHGKPKQAYKGCDNLLKMVKELATMEQRNFDLNEWKCVQASCRNQVCEFCIIDLYA